MTPSRRYSRKSATACGSVDTVAGLVARDAVHGHRFGVAVDLEKRGERVFQDDLAAEHSHGANRHEPIDSGVQAGRFGIQYHEADAIDWLIVAPRGVEAAI